MTRRLRTVTATLHSDGDFDFARWRQQRLRTVTATVTLHSDSECWEAGTTKQWTMLERRKEMGNEKHTVMVPKSTSIIFVFKIKKNNIYIYIYIHKIYTNSNYNRYKKFFLILQKCHHINFYTGWKYNWHKRSHIIYKIVIYLSFYTWWIWTGIIM